MGLDTIASRSEDDIVLTEDDYKAFEAADIQLSGGVLTDIASFRGKVYADVILEVTNIGLHQDWISPDIVKKMWQDLEACDPQEVVKNVVYPRWLSPQSIVELRKFFRVCADRGLGLLNWW